MPLTGIESYSPFCTEPVDFDRFWNATASAVTEVRPQPSLSRQESPAPGLHLDALKFTSLGHKPVSGYLLTHDVPEPRPLIVHTHGYNSQYDIMLNWARKGCHVCGIDVRGFGRSTGMSLAQKGWVLTGIDAPQTSIIRGAVADVWQAIAVARQLLGWRISRMTLTGFSFGGALAIMAAAYDSQANLLVAGQPTFGWHSERLRLSTAGSSAEIRHYLENNPDRAAQAMDTLRYFDTLHFATRVQKPTVIGAGLDDAVVPSRSVMGIASRLTSAPAELRLLPVSHSDDPRESLWAEFDNEWLDMTVNGVPADFGSEARRIREISQASRAA
jgi:cephalosporin-C deacetylase